MASQSELWHSYICLLYINEIVKCVDLPVFHRAGENLWLFCHCKSILSIHLPSHYFSFEGRVLFWEEILQFTWNINWCSIGSNCILALKNGAIRYHIIPTFFILITCFFCNVRF